MAFVACSQPLDDDLSSLDSLLNFNFQSLVPSMSIDSPDKDPPESPPSTTATESDTSQMLSKRPHFPSTTLPLVAANGAKKPPHTYPELIELAIEKCGPVTVSHIYSWIMSTFPYFQCIDDIRWKPGIRHTLTTHHMFRKVRKDQRQRGWQWSIVPEEERSKHRAAATQAQAHWKKQKMQQYERILPDYTSIPLQPPKVPKMSVPVSPSCTSSSRSSSTSQFAIVSTKEFFGTTDADGTEQEVQQLSGIEFDDHAIAPILGVDSNNANCDTTSDNVAVMALQWHTTIPSLAAVNAEPSRDCLYADRGSMSTSSSPLTLTVDQPISLMDAATASLPSSLSSTPSMLCYDSVGLLQIHQPGCPACSSTGSGSSMMSPVLPPPCAGCVSPPTVHCPGLWGDDDDDGDDDEHQATLPDTEHLVVD